MFRLVTAAMCSAALLLVGCGSSSDSSSTSTPASTTAAATTPSYCAEREALGQQIQEIKGVNVVSEGTAALKSSIDGALATFQSLAAAAKTDFPAQSAGLETAATSLKASVDQLSDSEQRGAALASLPGQLRTTVDAAKQLQTAVRGTCGA